MARKRFVTRSGVSPLLMNASAPAGLHPRACSPCFTHWLPNYFPLSLEFPARTQRAMDLLRGLLRVIALEKSIQPRFSPIYSFNPPFSHPLPSKAISLHIALVAESHRNNIIDNHFIVFYNTKR
jgi:hypothetical protein